jgi:hypothetical protein
MRSTVRCTRRHTIEWFRAATIAVMLSACSPTSPDATGVWGSSKASLIVSVDGAVLQILASGGCYGSYGELPVPIPSGAFELSGTYSQITGVYPGHVSYAAVFSGVRHPYDLSITVTVPDIARSFGPFTLSRDVRRTWPACLYP